MSCPEFKNIGPTLWVIQKTSFWFGRHVRGGPEDFKNHPTFVSSAIFGGVYGLTNMGTFFRDTLDNQAQSQDHIKHKTFFVGKKTKLTILKAD